MATVPDSPFARLTGLYVRAVTVPSHPKVEGTLLKVTRSVPNDDACASGGMTPSVPRYSTMSSV